MSEYLRPRSLAEAVAERARHPSYTVLAGGTDLLVSANRKPEPPGVIDIFGLAELAFVREDAGSITLGAATTYRELLASEVVRRHVPALAEAAREIGALQIQARGTIGGNMVTSSPVGDTLPVLLALDAVVVLAGPAGEREVPYTEFCTGYRQTALAANELVAAIRIPTLPPGTVQMWRKMGTRRAQSISKVMVAATARVEGGRIAELRIGIGAVAETPIRARAAEAAALGQAPGPRSASAARAALMAEITPITDVRSTAEYRARAAGNVVYRFLSSLS